jgi:hypothetical protein
MSFAPARIGLNRRQAGDDADRPLAEVKHGIGHPRPTPRRATRRPRCPRSPRLRPHAHPVPWRTPQRGRSRSWVGQLRAPTPRLSRTRSSRRRCARGAADAACSRQEDRLRSRVDRLLAVCVGLANRYVRSTSTGRLPTPLRRGRNYLRNGNGGARSAAVVAWERCHRAGQPRGSLPAASQLALDLARLLGGRFKPDRPHRS